MAKKRVTLEDDVQRLSERVWRESRGTITDYETYNYWFDKYLGKDINKRQDKQLREQTFDAITYHHRTINPDRHFKTRESKRQYETRKLQAEFTFVGMQKGKVVYARRIPVIRKNGKIIDTYRDKQGRFVKVSKKYPVIQEPPRSRLVRG